MNFEQVVGGLKNFYEECQNFTGPDLMGDRSTPTRIGIEALAARKFMERVKCS